MLENKTGFGITTGDGVVTLDLSELVRSLGEELGLSAATLDRLPPDAGELEIMRSDQLDAAQAGVKSVRVLSTWLLVLVLAMFALAIFLARGARRETLRNVGCAFVIVGLAVLVVRRLAGDYAVDALTQPSSEGSGKRVWLISTAILAQIGWAAVLYGAVVILGAVLAGPHRAAIAVRRRIAPVLNERPGAGVGGRRRRLPAADRLGADARAADAVGDRAAGGADRRRHRRVAPPDAARAARRPRRRRPGRRARDRPAGRQRGRLTGRVQPDPIALLRSRDYVRLLVLAALIGVPVSAVAYGFLKLVNWLQDQLFTELPETLGFDGAPTWWPAPLLALCGLLCALAIIHLPGIGGHSPADGFKPAGPLPTAELPGVVLAAAATLSFGAVLGPEAPLIMIGSGLGVLAVKLASRDAPARASTVIAAAGSFAAISSLLGNPILGAFLLLETAGLGGPMLGIVLLPGLLAAGVGMLIFLGLDELTGFGTFSLSIPGMPPFDRPTVAMFGWALVFGLVAPFVGRGIQLLALAVRPRVERRMVVLMPLLGVAIAGLAIGFSEATGHGIANVLFSGQNEIGPLVDGAGGWTVGALLLLILCKGVAYALSLSSFRGGPVFPALFIGAAGGMAAADLPGLELTPAVAMGIGAMCAVMLSLPLTSTLLATILLGSDGLAAMPLVIVAVVVAHVTTAHLMPAPATAPPPVPQPATAHT